MQRYRALLALPGARAPLVASALGSLPIGMYALAILLLAREATGSFAEAGRVAGAFGLANALGAVGQGRLMDRVGQPRVLRPVALAHALAMAALVVAAERRAPSGLLVACAVAGGGCLPQLPAAMRSLWGVLVEDEAGRHTAYAMVAIVFEVSVVAAPALVAAIVAVASPAAAVAAAAALASGAAVAFAATAASQRWRGVAHATGWLGPLVAPGMRTVFAAMAALGAAIGVVQVAVPAFTAERGSAELGGLLLACLSAGSMAGGLVYGARSWPGRPALRVAALLAGLGGGCALLAVAGSALTVAVVLLAVGLLLAPATIASSSLLDVVAPKGTATEAFSVMIMAIVAGAAGGNALGGALVDGASYEAAVLSAAAIAAAGAANTLTRRRTLA
jgi:MFS family permease